MLKSNLLKAKMEEREVTKLQTAEALGLKVIPFRRRVNGLTEFTLDEIQKLIVFLNLTPDDVLKIFFDFDLP